MSADELVDTVNADNQITGTVTRAEIRKNLLPHRASYAACCDRQGRFIVEVRTLSKDYAPGELDLCAGGVMQHGEEPDDAARRELYEELGLRTEDPLCEFYPLGTLKIIYANGRDFLIGYLYLVISDAVTVRQKSEVSGILCLKPREIEKLRGCCVRDSVIAFEEILRRAQGRGLLQF